MVSNLVRLTSKVASFARSGRITCARKLFDEMPNRDTVAWNNMLSSYSRLGLHQEALSLFTCLRFSDVEPDDFSFTAILSSCASLGEVGIGRKIQALVILSGYGSSLPVNNSLIDMYGKCMDAYSASKVFQGMCGDIRNEVTWCSLLFAYMNAGQFGNAYDVFTEMPRKVVIAWNIMISQCGEIQSRLKLFRDMQDSGCGPDCYTFSSLMNAFAESSELFYGRMIHALTVKNGWDAAVEVKNSVFSFYAKLGCKDEAMKVFELIEMLTQVSWNSIIDVYMKIGETDKAFEMFRLAPEKNIVTWTSMIAAYAKKGNGEQALRFFVDMMKSGVDSDHFAFGAALHACSSLSVLGHGRMVHACVICHGFQGHVYIGNSLVNMYAKCGDIKESNHAFDDVVNKDLVSWNTMLLAFGMHGLASQALKLYQDMIASGVEPDRVTFIGLLITCSYSGLLEEGCTFFELMNKRYGLSSDLDHVACMVDMLGRAGYLAEAKDLASTYNSLVSNTGSSTLETLLGACSIQADARIARETGELLKISQPSEEMSFVLLSNMYCVSGQWKEAENVRREMLEQGVKKTPGCSWIEVRNKVSAFLAGDSLHPSAEEISEILHFLKREMRNPCFSRYEVSGC